LLRSVLTKVSDDVPLPGEDDFPAVGNPNLVIVAAAGNGADTRLQYPAAENIAGLIAVGASTMDDALATFSTRGSWIAVAAPGDLILSSVPGGLYGTWRGTSMAAPFVAGEAALVRATFPSLTGRKIIDHIKRTSARIQGPIQKRIDAGAALTTTPEIETSTLQFSQPIFNVNEGAGSVNVTVTRTGVTTGTSTVDFRTIDDPAEIRCDVANGAAYARCDYATTVDTLTFAPGETVKSINIPIIDDSFADGAEAFAIRLSNPTGGGLGAVTTANVAITDNDTVNGANPILTTPFLVRQHYLDFLSREPEGSEPWTAVLNNCSDVNNNPLCDRLTVSAAFFGSPEFQLKGYYVYRFYKLAFNRLPLYSELIPDMRAVTGQTPAEVFQKKAAFSNAFVQRAEFGPLASMPPDQYVTALMGRYSLAQITTPDPAAPDGTNKVTLTTAQFQSQLGGGTLTRAQVLRAIADSDQVTSLEFNQAFVAMQYYGYLRRTPETAGYNAWLIYLNGHPTDSRTMVNGFMNSAEYRLRFGP
jgi:hypothetical protein